MNNKKIISVTLFSILTLCTKAADSCPCENNTKAYVGKDTCGKDVCEQDLVDKWPTDLSKVKPCTPPTPTPQTQVAAQDVNAPGGSYLKYSASGLYQYEYWIQMPNGTISAPIAKYGEWSELSGYQRHSTECGGKIQGETVKSSDWDPDLEGIAKIITGIFLPGGKIAIDFAQAVAHKNTVPGAPSIFGEPGEEGMVQYGTAYKCTATLSGGIWAPTTSGAVARCQVTTTYAGGSPNTGPWQNFNPTVDIFTDVKWPQLTDKKCSVSCCEN